MVRNFTLTIPAGIQLGEVCSSDSTARFSATASVLLSNNTLMATDGRIAAILPVAVDGEAETCLLPPMAANAMASKSATVGVNGQITRTVGAGTKAKTEIVADVLQEGRFPPLSQVMPNVANYTVLKIDVDYLMELAKAISTGDRHCVTLFLPPAEKEGYVGKPLAVLGHDDSGNAVGAGAIMPLAYANRIAQAEIATAKQQYADIVAKLPADTVRFPIEKPVAVVSPEVAAALDMAPSDCVVVREATADVDAVESDQRWQAARGAFTGCATL